MKKVVILSAFATPFRSGAEACAEEIAKYLKADYDITIVTSRMKRSLPVQDQLEGGVRVVRIGMGNATIDPWLFPLLAPFTVKKLQPDIVHAVLESFAGFALVLTEKIFPSAKRILTLQSTNTDLLLAPIHKAAQRITAISHTLIERAKKYGRTDVVHIPNGISLGRIRTACTLHPKIPGRIAFVGRLEQMKGIDTMLRAFARLPAEVQQYATLHIVGGGSLFATLETLSRQLGIASRVTFKGYQPVPKVYDSFAEAEVFCGLSRSEALGNVFLEAQAAGCAVLATNVGGIPDIVTNGRTGILVAPDDVQAATEWMEKLLTDGVLRKSLIAEGQENAAGYDWSVIAKQYAAVYAE